MHPNIIPDHNTRDQEQHPSHPSQITASGHWIFQRPPNEAPPLTAEVQGWSCRSGAASLMGMAPTVTVNDLLDGQVAADRAGWPRMRRTGRRGCGPGASVGSGEASTDTGGAGRVDRGVGVAPAAAASHRGAPGGGAGGPGKRRPLLEDARLRLVTEFLQAPQTGGPPHGRRRPCRRSLRTSRPGECAESRSGRSRRPARRSAAGPGVAARLGRAGRCRLG